MVRDGDQTGELRRLQEGPKPDERPAGAGIVRFIVRSPGKAPDVLRRAVCVMKIVNGKR